MPSVPIIMPIHNAADFVEEALVSILTEMWTDFEFVMIQDVSMNESMRIIVGFSGTRTRILLNDTPRSNAYLLDHDIVTAEGKFMVHIDADD